MVQLGHFTEIEIIGHDGSAHLFSQLNQLQVDLTQLGKVILDNLYGEQWMGLHLLQNIQPAPAALPPGAVGGVGYDLQLAQHELWNHQRSFQKTGLHHIGDAAIDNGAGVKDLKVALAGRSPFAGKELSQAPGKVQQVSLTGAHHQPDVGHQHEHKELQQGSGSPWRQASAEHHTEQRGACNAQHAAQYRAQEPL